MDNSLRHVLKIVYSNMHIISTGRLTQRTGTWRQVVMFNCMYTKESAIHMFFFISGQTINNYSDIVIYILFQYILLIFSVCLLFLIDDILYFYQVVAFSLSWRIMSQTHKKIKIKKPIHCTKFKYFKKYMPLIFKSINTCLNVLCTIFTFFSHHICLFC